MTTEKILQVVQMCRRLFEEKGIPQRRMLPDELFSSERLTAERQMLAHAHYLLDGVEEYANDPERKGKTGRHLASAQVLLWTAGWYTLGEIMNHNRPDES